MIFVVELLLYAIYSMLGGEKEINIYALCVLPVVFFLYILYKYINFSLFIYLVLSIIVISGCAISVNTQLKESIIELCNRKKFKDILIYCIYAILVFSYPIWNLFSPKRTLTTSSIVQFVVDVFCCWVVISFILAALVGIWLYITKTDEYRNFRLGCIAIAIMFVILFVFVSRSCNSSKQKHMPIQNNIYQQVKQKNKTNVNERKIRGVYICTGPQSRRYHRSRYCRGLNSCSDDIEEVDVSTAEDYGRTPCGICY